MQANQSKGKGGGALGKEGGGGAGVHAQAQAQAQRGEDGEVVSGELSAWSEPWFLRCGQVWAEGEWVLDLAPGSPSENVLPKCEGNGGSSTGPWAGEKQPLSGYPGAPGRGRHRGESVPGAAVMKTILLPSPRQPVVSETQRPQQPLWPYPAQAQSGTEKPL